MFLHSDLGCLNFSVCIDEVAHQLMNSGRGEEPLQSRIVDDQRCVSVT